MATLSADPPPHPRPQTCLFGRHRSRGQTDLREIRSRARVSERKKKNKHKKKEGKDEEGEEERKRPRHRRMRENKDIAQSGELLGSTLRSLKCLFDARERWQLFMCILCTCYFPHVCLCLCVCLVCRRGEERRGGGWRLESPEKREVFSLAQPEDECVGVVKSPSTRLREQQQLV